MALESGNYIAELVDTNPPGSDPKSQGDDHLRLIKRCTQNSFGAFVGNTATPKSVTLTEDEINQLPVGVADNAANIADNTAALVGVTYNAVDEAVAGAWTFNDLNAVAKKVGFRNPSFKSLLTGDYTAVQADEGTVLVIESGGGHVTLPTLEAGTTLRIANIEGNTQQIIRGAGLGTMRFLDGAGNADNAPNIAIQNGSIAEVYYLTATTAFVFGSGMNT